MAEILSLKTYTDSRGSLTVIDNLLPFKIERVFFIYGVDNSKRGGHRHYITRQAAVCIQGTCAIYNNDGNDEKIFRLDSPGKCLIIEPKDWHVMYDFSPNAILMVIASEPFNKKDYINEPYKNSIRRPKGS